MKKLIWLLLIPTLGFCQTADSIYSQIQQLEKDKQAIEQKKAEETAKKYDDKIQAKANEIKNLNSLLVWKYQLTEYLGSIFTVTILPGGKLKFQIVNYNNRLQWQDCDGGIIIDDGIWRSNTVYTIPSTATAIEIPPEKLLELLQWLKERGVVK